MGSDLFFWIDTTVSFFLGILMVVNFVKYKLPVFRLLAIILGIVLLKSILYLGIRFTDVQMIEENGLKILDKNLLPLYNFRYFLFQCAETLFVIALAYFFILSRDEAENKSLRSSIISAGAQAFFVILIAVYVSWVSLHSGEAGTFKTSNGLVEFFKGGMAKLLLVSWKIILLILAWTSVAAASGYIADHLKTINRHRKWLYGILVVEIFFYVYTLFTSSPAPLFAVSTIGLAMLAVFVFENHTAYITTFSEKVEGLNKEKDMIISVMKEISNVVGSGDFDMESVVRTIVDDSIKGTQARGGAVLLKDPLTNRLSVQYVKGVYPPSKPFKTMVNMSITESVILEKFKNEKLAPGEGLLGKVLETGEPIFIKDALRADNYMQTVGDFLVITSFIAVPLKTKDDIFGVLTIVDDSKMFTDSDISLLETLGEQAAITIKQVQMYGEILEKKQAEKEVGVAGEIQSSLVPHTFPVAEKYELYGFSIPAKGVGGDYYDYIDFSNNKIALVMFDVSGKGVPASLIMVMIRSILRTIATLKEDTKEILVRLNNTIAEGIVEDRYATGFYLLFDAEKGIMCYTNAGHGPMVVYRAGLDDFEFLDTEGMPVGIMKNAEYGQSYTILEKGDIAILYTDGITEAMSLSHEEFGMDRFKDVIRKYKKESAQEISTKMLEAINTFAGTAPQHDDETLMILKTK